MNTKFFRKQYRDVFGTSTTGMVAAQIRAIRAKKGWSQQQLAQAAGMGLGSVMLLEDPNCETLSFNMLKRVANALDVALVVRFVPFSKLLKMLDNETAETLVVSSFEDELGDQT